MTAVRNNNKVRHLDWALDQLTGSISANLVLIKMARKGNTSGMCWMLQSRIASEVGCGLSTIQRAISHLLENGYILDISKSYPHRITRTYLLCVDRVPAGQNEVLDNSNPLISAIQIDTQNPNESKYESRPRKQPSVDNLCRDEEAAGSEAFVRRKTCTPIGQLIRNFRP